MIIELKKFGTTLTSRDSGNEAYKAIQPLLSNLKDDEELILDFEGIDTFSPSWGDEFITALFKKYQDRLKLQTTDNLSVKATLDLLSEINKVDFNIK